MVIDKPGWREDCCALVSGLASLVKGRESMNRLIVGAGALFLGLLHTASAQTVSTEAGGVIVIEAEAFSNNTSRAINGTTFQWVATNAVAGYSGGGYMEATPNIGTNQNVTWLNVCPQLDYAVNFANALTHYVWIRGYAVANKIGRA